MDESKTVPEYDTPRIEDHGDLTELTAAGTVGKYADSTIYVGESIEGHLQTSP